MTSSFFKKFFWILLLPLSIVWSVLMFLRRRFSPSKNQFQFETPIVCVGNIHSGGSGKTPLLIEIANHFKKNKKIAILSRGYRSETSKKREGAWVDLSEEEGATRYGDEPWMMAHRLEVPIYIERKREKAIPVIESKHKPSLILMDDGFQYLKLKKNIQIVLISAQKKPEDSFCLPLGELREPLSAIREASAVVITSSSKEQTLTQRWKEFLRSGGIDTPLFVATREVEGVFEGNKLISLSEQPFGVFSGIASANGFLEDVKNSVGEFKFHISHPDHFKYTETSLKELERQTHKLGLRFWLTTDKDWYKIKPRWNLSVPLYSLRIRYKIEDKFWELFSQ